MSSALWRKALLSAPPAGRTDKRPHSAIDSGDGDGDISDNENAAGSTPGPIPFAPNQNIAVAAARYAERKRLKVDQIAAVDAFLHDPASLREVKLLVHLMAVENHIDKIITATAPYQVSPALEKNISNYAAAVLLSSKIRTYKGSTPTNVIVDILKKHRFDLPTGIEHNPADFSKVIATVQEALTQKRSKFKKFIIYSLKPHDTRSVDNAAAADQLNIFQLAQVFVDGTQCSVNVPLCARVALMRKVYLQEPGAKFWDHVDKALAKIRRHADGDNKKIAKAFRHILTADQERHGVNDYVLDDETVDLFQQEVDDLIDATVMNATSST
ncbi:hypothetical protein C8F04DRAFT_1329161 [Mycena alexandri]|uniref:Uncharacterized protein n=1 Tax=Mycena alexandri TaxID=1745969 RepID=A0AAD6WMP6_9AGAR|nr:hypothetical protein C8F04DRAFT_1329161 [Mycena alexandri]